MTWHDLLFAHWPIAPNAIRAAMARVCSAAHEGWSAGAHQRARAKQDAGQSVMLPRGLELDTFEGNAWIGVVPFHMTNVTGRWMPALPGISTFAELNLRTYVTVGGKPGVFFFSLDAASPFAVWAARRWFKLPYFNSHISVERDGEAVSYRATRIHGGAAQSEFSARYEPAGPVYASTPGTLEHWLTERYCLYGIAGNQLLRGDIQHPPWPLQPARAEITVNSLVEAQGLSLPQHAPVLHFARKLDVVGWPPVPAAL